VFKYEGTKCYFTLYKYDPLFTPSHLLASRDEADYSTPEGTYLAVESARGRDAKWYLSLFDGDRQKRELELDKIIAGARLHEDDKDKPLSKPRQDIFLYKIEFNFNGERYALIRVNIDFSAMEKGLYQESDIQFIKVGNLWLKTSLPPFTDHIRGFIGDGGYKRAMEISQPQSVPLLIKYWREWERIINTIKTRKRGQKAISERIRKVEEIFEEERLKKQEIAQKIKNSTATLEERLFSLNIQPLEGKAPDFTLFDLAGKKKVSLSDFKGKVIILYCWYVDWCQKYPEMLEDMCLLNKLAQKIKDKGLVVLTIHKSREIKEANSFAMKEKFTFVNLADTGPYGDVANLYKTAGVPDAIIIDKESNLIGKCPRYPRNWTSTEVIELFHLLTSAK